MFEIDGATLNFEVEIKSSSYLEDAHFEFIISKERVLLADKLFPDPRERSPARFLLNNDEYPEVSIMDDKYHIRQSYGDIRHLVPTHIFQEPLRLACLYEPNQEIIIEVKIFAKNLSKPRVQYLKIGTQ